MTVFRAATLRTFFFAIHAGAKELNSNNQTNPPMTVIFNYYIILNIWNNGSLLGLKKTLLFTYLFIFTNFFERKYSNIFGNKDMITVSSWHSMSTCISGFNFVQTLVKSSLRTKKNSTVGIVFLQNSYACNAVTMELVFVLDKLSVVSFFLMVPLSPSQCDFPWPVAKKFHAASNLKFCLRNVKFKKIL